MSYHVAILPTAQRDLRRILSWIAERSPGGAARLLSAFDTRLHDIGTSPEMFGLAPESQYVGQEIRQSFFRTPRGRRYRLLFRIVGPTVEVLHVRGPGQDLLSAEEFG
jgi:plasmid stabilization system protein ParE